MEVDELWRDVLFSGHPRSCFGQLPVTLSAVGVVPNDPVDFRICGSNPAAVTVDVLYLGGRRGVNSAMLLAEFQLSLRVSKLVRPAQVAFVGLVKL